MHGPTRAPWRDYLEKARGQFFDLARPDVRFVAIARGKREDSPQPKGYGQNLATEGLHFLSGWDLAEDPANPAFRARFSLHGTHKAELPSADAPPNPFGVFQHAAYLATTAVLTGGYGPLKRVGIGNATHFQAMQAWIRTLFDLSWGRHSVRLPARRTYWASMVDTDGETLDLLMHCSADVAESFPIGECPPPNPLAAAGGPMRFVHWSSTIADVVGASVAACDYLLAYQEEDVKHGNSKRKRRPGSVEKRRSALEKLAEKRAKKRQAAADREWQAINARDAVEHAWERIYVASPQVGQPVDYDRWAENLVNFAAVAEKTGFAEAFVQARTTDADEAHALSLVQAAIAGGTEAVLDRLTELDSDQDDYGWKRVFNHNTLFWRTLRPSTVADEARQPADDGGVPPAWSEAAKRIDSTPRLPRPPERHVESAMRDVPEVLASIGPNWRDEIEESAEQLAYALSRKGHSSPAAQWAIHRLVSDEKLSTDIREIALPIADLQAESRRGIYSVPDRGPTPFDSFIVRATEALWEWWHHVLDEGDGADSSIEGAAAPGPRRRTNAHGKATATRRGRPKADYLIEQREAAIAEDWSRAREAKVYKPKFARDQGMSPGDLDKLLDRVRQRKRRSDN